MRNGHDRSMWDKWNKMLIKDGSFIYSVQCAVYSKYTNMSFEFYVNFYFWKKYVINMAWLHVKRSLQSDTEINIYFNSSPACKT